MSTRDGISTRGGMSTGGGITHTHCFRQRRNPLTIRGNSVCLKINSRLCLLTSSVHNISKSNEQSMP